MSSTPPNRIFSPEEIALRAGTDPERRILPEAGVFAERALRLRQLAAGHSLRDYLMLMAVVCEAQHRRLAGFPTVPLPSAQQIQAASETGQPLLSILDWPRDPAWRSEWRALMADVLLQLPGDSPARAGVEAAQALDDDALEHQATRLLSGITLGLDVGTAPLVAAGLQLYWTALTLRTAAADAQAFGDTQDATRCPCCGSLPAASITRSGGRRQGQRYLHCTLCNTEWQMNRVQCTHCLASENVRYESLQPVSEAEPPSRLAAVEAETCGSCRHYLKILHMERDAQVEPLADDLASLTLDLLVSEAGFSRHGVNLLLLFGDPEPGDPALSERGPS